MRWALVHQEDFLTPRSAGNRLRQCGKPEQTSAEEVLGSSLGNMPEGGFFLILD